jgi:hypothetical protein
MTWQEQIDNWREWAIAEAARLKRIFVPGGDPSSALSLLIRPNLGPTPAALRRFLEPVVAASALLAVVVLTGIGALGVAAMLTAVALIYLIVTKVFGIELDLVPPPIR